MRFSTAARRLTPVILLAVTAPVVLRAQPPPETPAQRDARMAWWREARFGMFVHWGLYSALAGNWQGRVVRGDMSWLENRVQADTDTYAKEALPQFTPKTNFAQAWVSLAKQAGCQYIVLTTKHHEGFALFDSQVSDFDAGSRLHRDLVREFVEAARAAGLRIGFYYSVIDWHHDQYAYALSKQLPHPLRNKPYPNGTRDHAKYQAFIAAQVSELVSNYGPIDIFWWDYSAQDFQGDAAWRATDLMAMVRAKQPNIIMNNRLYRIPEAGWKGMGTGAVATTLDTKYGDFITPEQRILPTKIPGVDWETCMTMNTTWGYSEHNHDWKSNETLIRNLIDIASKGGNYLLNIGPTGDGSVPAASVRSLKAIGKWMGVNDEAIYGTTASPFDDPPWGRVTAKGRTLYLHVFQWPADGRLSVPLKTPVTRAVLLSDTSKPLTVTTSDDQTVVALPAAAPDPTASVIRLDLSTALTSPTP